jgi:trimeric autotransporter adhesin
MDDIYCAALSRAEKMGVEAESCGVDSKDHGDIDRASRQKRHSFFDRKMVFPLDVTDRIAFDISLSKWTGLSVLAKILNRRLCASLITAAIPLMSVCSAALAQSQTQSPNFQAKSGTYAGSSATASGDSSTAAGGGALASGQSSTAVGGNASATGYNSTALGIVTVASGYGSLASGWASLASGDYSTALGNVAQAYGSSSIAIGSNAVAGTGMRKASSATPANDIALGNSAQASGGDSIAEGNSASATGTASLVLGSKASDNGNANATVIGQGAGIVKGLAGSNVALGQGASVSAAAVPTANGTINGTAYTYAGGAPIGVVSVGTKGGERQITNVAAGQVSTTSTDAVNGSQLNATNQLIKTNTTTIANNTTAITNLTNGSSGPFVSDQSVTTTSPISSGANAAAGGFGASATGAASLVLGNQARDNGNANATVIGQGASIANGVSGSNVALGQGSLVTTAAVPNTAAATFAGGSPVGVVSVGSVGKERQITNVAAGQVSATSTDAINGSQLFYTIQNIPKAIDGDMKDFLGGLTSSFVSNNAVTGTMPVATGANSSTGGFGASGTGAASLVLGNQASDNGNANATVIGQGASIGNGLTGSNVALGQGASVSAAAVPTASGTINGTTYTYAGGAPAGLVSVGTKGKERQITSVAAGQVNATSTDAVNGSQLNATNQQVSANTTIINSIASGGGIRYFHVNSALSDAVATGGNGVAIGPQAHAYGNNSVAIGLNAMAGVSGGKQINDIALGNSAQAIGGNSIAAGTGAIANSAGALAIGASATATGGQAVSMGSGNTATGDGAVAIGDPNNANGIGAVALGNSGNANGTGAVALGNSGNANGEGALALGDSNNAQGQGSVATGNSGNANGTGAVVLGNSGIANGEGALALGDSNNAQGQGSVATGNRGNANGTGAVALGNSGNANGTGAVVLGNSGIANGEGALALGDSNNAQGQGSVAIGNASNVTAAGGIALGDTASTKAANGLSLGSNAVATNANDVALGARSITSTVSATSSVTINGTAYTLAGAAPGSTVSVGALNNERTITNVAAGRVNQTSTDAVNGSELYATNQAINALGSNIVGVVGNAVQYDTADRTRVTLGGTGAKATVALTNVASGAVSSTSTDAVNGAQLNATDQLINANTTTIANNTTAITNLTNGSSGPFVSDQSVTATQPVSSGANAAAGGFGASATGAASLVLGNQASDNGNANATVIGQGAGIVKGLAGSNVALGQGASVSAAAVPTANGTINGTAYTYAGGAPIGVVSIGTKGGERQITNVAAGQVSTASTDAVNGSQLYATNLQMSANATALNTLAGNAVQYDTTGKTSVTLGGAGAKTAVVLTNVAPGALTSVSTDAVNGAQLNTTNQQVASNITTINSLTTGAIGPFVSDQSVTTTQPISSGANATAGGFGASATGAASTVVGNQATDNGNANATVIGQGASIAASVSGSNVALGQGASVSSAAVPIANGTIGGTPYTYAGGTPVGVVSVGTKGKERQITNVAAGQITATSTDATNGSQLYATQQQVNSNTTTIANTTTAITNLTSGLLGPFVSNNAVNVAQPVSSGVNASAGGFGAIAAGNASLVLGNGATDNSNANATVIGQGASIAASVNGSNVALGQGASVSSAAVATANGTFNGVLYTYAGGTPVGVVSVGTAGGERQITNVAAGQVNATSTDAINGSQLYAMGQVIDNLRANVSQITTVDVAANNKYFQANSTAAGSRATGNDAVAAGPATVSSGTNSIAAGNGSIALNTNDASYGSASRATGGNSVAIGSNSSASSSSSTAIGANAKAAASNATAIGSGSVANRANTVSIGATGNNRQITNVASGTEATDAVNVSQLNAATAGSVKYDTLSNGSIDYSSVTVGTSVTPSQIHNVANGVAPNDVVNVGQLNEGVKNAENWAQSYTDQRLNTVNQDLNAIGNRANAGIASAMAMAGLPQAYQPNQNSAAVALGSFHGQTGIAVGLSTVSESGRYVYKVNFTDNTRGDAGVSVGAAVTW